MIEGTSGPDHDEFADAWRAASRVLPTAQDLTDAFAQVGVAGNLDNLVPIELLQSARRYFASVSEKLVADEEIKSGHYSEISFQRHWRVPLCAPRILGRRPNSTSSLRDDVLFVRTDLSGPFCWGWDAFRAPF